MILAVVAFIVGLIFLVWGADRFVTGAAGTARYFGMPTLLIGMIIVGFGTSAPEMLVSAMAAWQGSPGIAIGNAFGSNIANIALVLGCAALINPIKVHSKVLKKEFPILIGATLLVLFFLWGGNLTRVSAIIFLLAFVAVMGWSFFQGMRDRTDAITQEFEKELTQKEMTIGYAISWLIFGFILLIISSRVIVWGAVKIAYHFGANDLIIGITIVALGTSLPELASSIIAALKNEHDIALGNVIGSNLFNTLAVIGIAGVIHPASFPSEEFLRDMLVMTGLTIALFFLSYGFRGKMGEINRYEGGALLLFYLGYFTFLILQMFK